MKILVALTFIALAVNFAAGYYYQTYNNRRLMPEYETMDVMMPMPMMSMPVMPMGCSLYDYISGVCIDYANEAYLIDPVMAF